MLDLSFAELLVIVVGVVLFIRPADVPVVLRSVVKAIRTLRHFWDDIKRQVMHAIDEDESIKTIKEEVGGGRRFILDDTGNYREVYDVAELFELKKADEPVPSPEKKVSPDAS